MDAVVDSRHHGKVGVVKKLGALASEGVQRGMKPGPKLAWELQYYEVLLDGDKEITLFKGQDLALEPSAMRK